MIMAFWKLSTKQCLQAVGSFNKQSKSHDAMNFQLISLKKLGPSQAINNLSDIATVLTASCQFSQLLSFYELGILDGNKYASTFLSQKINSRVLERAMTSYSQ
jgi:hypothetical protein